LREANVAVLRIAGTSDAPADRMLMPPVSRYMTASVDVVGPHDQLATARTLMAKRGVHHVPVMEAGALVGILSDRDVNPIHPLHDVRVAETMTEPVVTAERETPIDQVIQLMERHRCSSIVIVGREGVEGIFTVTDALRALGDVLRRAVEDSS
jgi:acetoin utilization protein AcuB